MVSISTIGCGGRHMNTVNVILSGVTSMREKPFFSVTLSTSAIPSNRDGFESILRNEDGKTRSGAQRTGQHNIHGLRQRQFPRTDHLADSRGVKVSLHDERCPCGLRCERLDQALVLSKPSALPPRLLLVDHQPSRPCVDQVGIPVPKLTGGIRKRQRRRVEEVRGVLGSRPRD